MVSSVDGLAGAAAVGSQGAAAASRSCVGALTGAWGRAGPRLYAGRAAKPAAGLHSAPAALHRRLAGSPPRARSTRRSRCERSSHHGVEKRTAAHARRRLECETAGFGVPSLVPKWRALRESNPCYRRERPVSWTARRRARGGVKSAATYKDLWRRGQAWLASGVWPPRLTIFPCSASSATAPWGAGRRPSAGVRSNACRASARTPWCRRAAAG